MPTNDIMDNRSRELAPEIKAFLADSIRAHFAVGYFFLSGFQAIAEHIPHLDRLRLLIGNVTNRQAIEQLAEGYHHLATVQRAVRRQRMAGAQASRIRTETAASIQATLELMDQTDDAQALALSLAGLIAQGVVQVRVYTRGRLHAKAYLFDAEEDPEEKARLALLSEILTAVPLTARAHRELNTLRRSNVTGHALVAQLLHIVRDYNLEQAHRAITDQAEVDLLIPRVICSEALL